MSLNVADGNRPENSTLPKPLSEYTKLNYGCGSNKFEDYLNVDCSKTTNPDLIWNISMEPLPLADKQLEEICFFHTIEHIQKILWDGIFLEFNRLLGFDGKLLISYPEFRKCFELWDKTEDDFYEHTMFGLQRYKSDYHVAIADSGQIKRKLAKFGFHNFIIVNEPSQEFNTVLMCEKARDVIEKDRTYRV